MVGLGGGVETVEALRVLHKEGVKNEGWVPVVFG
jgi:hypothetical protein